MENKVNISSLISETTKHIGEVAWVNPRDVTGLPSKSEVQEMELSEDWDESFSDELVDYIKKWFEYTRKPTYIDDGHAMSPVERYVDSMLYIYVNYHNSSAALFSLSSEQIDVESARKCLRIFCNYLLEQDLAEHERSIIQMYMTDLYQYDDLWDPPEGRFHKEFTKSENILVDFLGTHDLSVKSLKKYGVPEEIIDVVSETKLIKRIKKTGSEETTL